MLGRGREAVGKVVSYCDDPLSLAVLSAPQRCAEETEPEDNK